MNLMFDTSQAKHYQTIWAIYPAKYWTVSNSVGTNNMRGILLCTGQFSDGHILSYETSYYIQIAVKWSLVSGLTIFSEHTNPLNDKLLGKRADHHSFTIETEFKWCLLSGLTHFVRAILTH